MDSNEQVRDDAHLPEELIALRQWWNTNGSHTVIALVVVLAIAFGGFYYLRHRRQQAIEASAAISNAVGIEQIESAIGSYPSTPATISGRLKLAKAYFDAGRYPLAQETYDAFLAEHPEHMLADIARVGSAATQEALENFDAAREQYAGFAAANPEHYLTPQAILGQARCLALSGRKDEARDVLERFIASHQDDAWGANASAALKLVDRIKTSPRSAAGLLERMDAAAVVETPPEAAPSLPAVTTIVEHVAD